MYPGLDEVLVECGPTQQMHSKIPPIIKPEELRRIETRIAEMIQHENELLNHRIQWFLTLNGFLFTAVALYGNQPGRNWFGTALAILGLLVCYSFGIGLQIGGRGFRRLVDIWQDLCSKCHEDFHEVGVYGHLANGFQEKNLAPWRALPLLMAIGWISVMVFVWSFKGEHPPGTFTPILIQEAEKTINGETFKIHRVEVLNTKTGEKVIMH